MRISRNGELTVCKALDRNQQVITSKSVAMLDDGMTTLYKMLC